ncbi:MAG TPA: hypothetical protein VH817_10040 [Thermoleophilaceae bacterium]|jgi:hypothetical protein
MTETVRLLDPPRGDGILLITSPPPREPSHFAWIAFVGTWLLLVALLNLLFGFVEVLNDYYFTGDTVLAGNHSLWGWLYITIGVVLLLILPLVLMRNPVGVVLAIVAVLGSIVSHILGFGDKPGWSIVALAIDALVLFALLSYALPPRQDRRRFVSG